MTGGLGLVGADAAHALRPAGAEGVLDSVEVYNPLTDAVSILPSLIQGRSDHNSEVVGGQVIVAGGSGMTRGLQVEGWDPKAEVWEMKTDYPPDHEGFAGFLSKIREDRCSDVVVVVEHDYLEEASNLWVQAEARLHDQSLECAEDSRD